MKIHKKCLIERATSEDASRTAITEPYLSVTDGKGELVATNGRIMAVIPVVVSPEDVSGYVSESVLKVARKIGGARTSETTIALNGMATLTDGSTLPRAADAMKNEKFPKYSQVFPAVPDAPAFTVCLDAGLLWKLAQAMGTEGVRLVFKDADSPIWVFPNASGVAGRDNVAPAEPNARGIQMPIATTEKA